MVEQKKTGKQRTDPAGLFDPDGWCNMIAET